MNRSLHCLAAILLSTSAFGAVTTGALAQTFIPVTDATLANPDPADWLMIDRTYDEQRFSPLNQINTGWPGRFPISPRLDRSLPVWRSIISMRELF